MFLRLQICFYYFFVNTQREIPGPTKIDIIEVAKKISHGTNLDEDDICTFRSNIVYGEEK